MHKRGVGGSKKKHLIDCGDLLNLYVKVQLDLTFDF